jgi:AraC-like DNA-binding protein
MEALGMKGVSSDAFLQRGKLEPARLSDPYAWFSVDEFDSLLLVALELTQDPAFGLHWGESSPMMQYDVLPPLVSQAKSLQEAIQSVLRFQLILAERPEVEFRDQGGRASFCVTPLAATPTGLRVRSEMTAVSLLRMLKVVGPAARPVVTRATFTHPCPAYREEYERLFGPNVRFEQPACSLEFEYGALDAAGMLHNQELHQTLAAQAERVLQRVVGESTYVERLKRLVQRKLPEVLQIPDAARSLGISERSLRRRLSEEGASYSQLVIQSQLELARNMLDNPVKSIKEVAYDTGFAGQSAFHRAFKRWTGTSPAQYRLGASPRKPA